MRRDRVTARMVSRELSRAYAQAIYDTALATWVRDLSFLRDNLRQDDSHYAKLEDESIPFDTRKSVVDQLLPGETSHELRNLVYTLVGEGHLRLLSEIIADLRRYAEHGLKFTIAQVTTAIEPTEQERAGIERRLISRYHQNIDIVWRVDPAILGGVVIQVGDEVTDDSLASRLESLRLALKSKG